MAPSREAPGSVLGKRSHQTAHVDARDVPHACDGENIGSLPTPDSTPNPKRAKTTSTLLDGDHNKENIPPFVLEAVNASTTTSRFTRSLRRTSTVAEISPRPGTPRRPASMSNIRQAVAATPATSMSQLTLVTPPPSPPAILLPLHVRVRALLRPTCNEGPQLAGREQERSRIEGFLRNFMIGAGSESNHSALYISGSPGTGKTALVNATLHALADELSAQDIQLLVVNCMALEGIDAVWQQLSDMLVSGSSPKGRGRKVKGKPQQVVETAFASRNHKCVVVLDELDHIASNLQVLSPLFALAASCTSNLRLIGIANTHTLTSTSTTTFSVQSLVGVDTVHFAPYTPEQLLGILQTRLLPLYDDKTVSVEQAKRFLPLPTLTLLSKKVASQTGDVRAVFEVLRGAVDIAVNSVPSSDALDTPIPIVTPSHILAALKAYAPAGKTAAVSTPLATASTPRKALDSETVTKVRELGLQQRLVLLSALLATKATEAGIAINNSVGSSPRSPAKRTHSSPAVQSSSKMAAFEMGQLHSYYAGVVGRTQSGVFSAVSRSEFGDLAGVLEVVGFLTISSTASLPTTPKKPGKKSFSRSMSFTGSSGTQEVRFVEGVRLDEIARGLGLGPDDTPSNAREEEVRAIFQREQARITREAKSRGQATSVAEVVGFEEATEE